MCKTAFLRGIRSSLMTALTIAVVLFTHQPCVYAQAEPPGYVAAADAFGQLSLDDRVRLQILLTAAGYWPAVPNADFSTRLFNAIGSFEADNGFPPLGFLGSEQADRLRSVGGAQLGSWGFRIIQHPVTGTQLWVPVGLNLTQENIPTGLRFTHGPSGLILTFDYFPDFQIRDSFEALLRSFEKKGFKIEYDKLYRDQFFAVSISDGVTDGYVRYHQFGRGGVGFTLFWNHSASEFHIERVATLISGSLWASMSGAPFTTPFGGIVSQASAPPAPALVPTEKPQQQDHEGPDSGTGFFVTSQGQILTNSHVVSKCADIRVSLSPGTSIPATVIARDTVNDLALLQSGTSPAHVASLRANIRLGENIEAFGYPLAGILATSGNFTLGNVTALSGLGDDSRYMQISVPVQPGNSGGPLLDQSGNLVGVVSAKLNALKIMVATEGDIPQNVNFAIKSSIVANFLTSNGIKYLEGAASQVVPPADLADEAKAISVYVECR